MTDHKTHSPHGSGIRGLNTADALPEKLDAIDNHQGQFGRLFNLPPGEFKEHDLYTLATAMRSDDGPKDGADDEESHIPSAYTYFGQFIDHDLTFDPSSFKQQKSDPNGIIDFRTPRFDMDNVYGRGPADQPFLYDGNALLQGTKFFPVKRNPNARDLPRSVPDNNGTRRAIIGDPRNDENAIVSQFQGMMFRFHNRVVQDSPKGESFDAISRSVRWHYQWLVVHDFLTRIVREDVLNSVSPAILDPNISFKSAPPQFKIFTLDAAVMPVEFSVAAYRLGHSMVRPGYRVNENIFPLPIFDHDNPSSGLNAFGEFPNNWTIDWQRFIDLGIGPKLETDTDRVQLAYKLDTSLVEPLGNLPASVAGQEAVADKKFFSLAFRNLRRGVLLKLPTGQAIANVMGVDVLHDKEIIIGAATVRKPPLKEEKTITDIASSFAGNCPLWVYVLAEARKNFYDHGEARLGDVGGRIVAETFLKLLVLDQSSYIQHTGGWKPTLAKNNTFTLATLLNYALGN